MSDNSFNLIGGLLFLVMGVLALAFNKYLGKKSALLQEKFFEIMGGPIRHFQVAYFLAGLVFVVFGCLLMLGTLKTQ